jgi:CRP-like cAMP-binding protein
MSVADFNGVLGTITAHLAKLTWAEALGYIGAALSITANSMRTMIPLRCIGIATNCTFIVYGALCAVYPTLIVNLVVLPLNVTRLSQMLRLIRQVKQASRADLSMEWLKPFMTRREVRAGETLFRKGDTADCMFYTLNGRFRLLESGLEIPTGQVVGEMAFLSPENRRTQTLECAEAGVILAIGYDELRQLYFQNPEFGFYFLRLTSERLFQNMARLEQELAAARAAKSEHLKPVERAA